MSVSGLSPPRPKPFSSDEWLGTGVWLSGPLLAAGPQGAWPV